MRYICNISIYKSWQKCLRPLESRLRAPFQAIFANGHAVRLQFAILLLYLLTIKIKQASGHTSRDTALFANNGYREYASNGLYR